MTAPTPPTAPTAPDTLPTLAAELDALAARLDAHAATAARDRAALEARAAAAEGLLARIAALVHDASIPADQAREIEVVQVDPTGERVLGRGATLAAALDAAHAPEVDP